MRTEDMKGLSTEIEAMMDSLSAVKGPKYSNAVMLLVNLSNFIKLSTNIADNELAITAVVKSGLIFMKDAVTRVMVLTYGDEKLPEGTGDALMKDIMMIIKKQSEYEDALNSTGGKNPPEGS